MSNEKNPYLCGGVLFLLLNKVKQHGGSGRDLIAGKANKHSNTEVMKDLMLALRLDDSDKEQQLFLTTSFGKDVSNYINCIVNETTNLPFADDLLISNYSSLVETQYARALEKMQSFIQAHLKSGLDERVWLVKAILDIIENDPEITDSDQFYIAPDGTPRTKEEIRTMNDFCLPAVLVGVMHYILLYHGNNKKGEDTLNQWSKKQDGRGRKYTGDAGKCIVKDINVALECAQSAVCVGKQEHEQIEEYPCDQGGSSQQEPSLDEIYKAENDTPECSQEVNPDYNLTEALRLYNVDELIKFWGPILPQIKDREVLGTIVEILDVLNQHRIYLSDELLQVEEDGIYVITDNLPDKGKYNLVRALQADKAELDQSLEKLYKKMNDYVQIKPELIDVLFPEEKENTDRSDFQCQNP